ncbi:hypothetical protein GUITHDRAFT_157312 [Guillardia theta CCMP2712]|uniref:Uncharacterized protein n=1 Tax=Guillardia theta (strain CCMP2712) TaxID=905079 RepID=L1JPN9_GUITC|nr:hypothetical protein GUITHDRAFT_157312 [Guillardia theta CCMP2712]EKX50160.1 hypothetical protein GUITHDRAFT_157312 [Guillardia theta CCMP2712]|eukprot:XP_005837140.1 hypothetical protein GUITHDRAFT_157312 [Guillardia theta CCMP2712]
MLDPPISLEYTHPSSLPELRPVALLRLGASSAEGQGDRTAAPAEALPGSCGRPVRRAAARVLPGVPLSTGTMRVRLDSNGSDNYKEASRLYRRTIFTSDDWLTFRSTERLFSNLSTMFTSGIIRGLWVEVGVVTLTALLAYFTNAAILNGLIPDVPRDGTFMLALPTLPFQLSSPALALLLVFRTNTVYARWNEARCNWMRIEHLCSNIARQGMSYLEKEYREEHARRVVALSHVLKDHFRHDPDEEQKLKSKLTQLLGRKESERIMSSSVRPVQALADITRIVRRSQEIDGSTKARFDLHLDELTSAWVACDRLQKMPVPLVYTRHTGRFLALWILLLPFALVKELGDSFLMVPVCSLVGVFFFGIEELGVQIEEPFSILPLEDYVDCIERNEKPSDPVVGEDAEPWN